MICPGSPGSFYYLFFRRIVSPVGDILPDGPAKKPGILKDHSENSPEVFPFHVPDIYSINGDTPFLYVVKSHKKVHQGSLPGTGGAYDGNILTCLHLDIHFFDQGNIRFILECDGIK